MLNFFKSKSHLLWIALLIGLAIVFLGHSVFTQPRDPDNLLFLSDGERSSLYIFTSPMFSTFPVYRPIPRFLVWLQYAIHSTQYIPLYFAFNLFLWVSCICLFYYFLFKSTKSHLASFIASALFLLDTRLEPVLTWISERQNLLVVFFGLLILLILQKYKNKKISPIYLINIFLFLIGAIFSKEFGLIFIFVLPLVGYLYKIKNLKIFLAMSAVALLMFVLARALFISPTTPYCPGTAFFWHNLPTCENINGLRQLIQYIYHILATLVGSFFPYLFFNNSGLIFFKYSNPLAIFYLIQDIFYIFIFFVSLKYFKKNNNQDKWIALSMIGFSALFSFALFRPRNHLTAMIGVYWLFALGLAFLLKKFAQYSYQKRKLMKNCLYVFLALMILGFGLIIRKNILVYEKSSLDLNPCEFLSAYPQDISSKLVENLNKLYGLPECKP